MSSGQRVNCVRECSMGWGAHVLFRAHPRDTLDSHLIGCGEKVVSFPAFFALFASLFSIMVMAGAFLLSFLALRSFMVAPQYSTCVL